MNCSGESHSPNLNRAASALAAMYLSRRRSLPQIADKTDTASGLSTRTMSAERSILSTLSFM